MRADRDYVRRLIGSERFIEIYCQCALEICEGRDVKGIYKKARAGKITHMIGIDEPYEEPANPDFIIDTGLLTPEESTLKILSLLQDRNYFSAFDPT